MNKFKFSCTCTSTILPISRKWWKIIHRQFFQNRDYIQTLCNDYRNSYNNPGILT